LLNSQPSSQKNNLNSEVTLASIYLNENNFQHAFSTYKYIGSTFGWNEGRAEEAGQTAFGAKDYTDAIYYFQKADTFALKPQLST